MSTSAVGPNKAGYVFGEVKDEGPNKVLGILPVNTYLTQYTDGAGKKCVRMVFQAKGAKTMFILQEKVGGAYVATAATPWFNDAFPKKLRELGLEVSGKEGVEGAESL